ncbi:aspartate/glutamate racemase family protein [Jannaschia donghaensis]|uniref:Hydantoin racemase n=1 Tax=Jannaschia donghaensis TaxID=420998 RepID=A0A0M6YLN9_9RHOB|nr:aspartate/glutamate racemase family protein [Jannaschia donghaensis]CTQ51278.1 Hydantoin racemase [Jannaschia donghaensis]
MIAILNPNSTASMTRAMLAAARAAAPDLAFEGWTSEEGPPAIQGPADGKAAAGPLIALAKRAADGGAQGIIIGCFDDTALQAVVAAVPCPVIGIGQAAFTNAALRQWRFSVVTTLPVAVPVIEANIARYGFAAHLGRVRAADVPVLALDHDPGAACAPILAQARAALADEAPHAIVLGCAGMVALTARMRAALPVPVIDPVEAAATCMRWLVPDAAS